MNKLWWLAAALMGRSHSPRLRFLAAAIPVVALGSRMMRERRARQAARIPMPGKTSDFLVSNARRSPELRAEDVESAAFR